MKYVGKIEDPNAETVYARACTSLTELNAPNAKTVYARACTSLTELNAPNAKTVDARACTSLTLEKNQTLAARASEAFVKSDLLPLLRAGGRFEEAMKPEHWACHSWENCPMAAAFGVNSASDAPKEWQSKVNEFIRFFDNGLLTRDMVPGITFTK